MKKNKVEKKIETPQVNFEGPDIKEVKEEITADMCPHCLGKGKAQDILDLRYPCPPFIDKDGKMHHHDTNTYNITYRCSRGHVWRMPRPKHPCWCGWTE